MCLENVEKKMNEKKTKSQQNEVNAFEEKSTDVIITSLI